MATGGPQDQPTRLVEGVSESPTDYAKAFSRLCHLAALTRTGKTTSAIDNLLLATIAADPTAKWRPDDGLTHAVFNYWGLSLPEFELNASFDRLRNSDRLTATDDGRWQVDSATLQTMRTLNDEARQLQETVCSEWLERVKAAIPATDFEVSQLWPCLQSYLTATFHRHGIQALELLGATESGSSADGSLSRFLDRAIGRWGLNGHEETVRSAFRLFFTDPTPNRTRYLTELLDATFTYFALTVDELTSGYLHSGLQPLKVFLDTNFIFGILGLHQPYFVELSRQLLELVRERKLPFTLYYHERTLREFLTFVTNAGMSLRETRWSPALSSTAVTYGEQTGRITGLELAYHRLNSATPTDLDVFLTKYEHVDRLLESEGISIYRDQSPDTDDAARKFKLIGAYEAFVNIERPDRPKRYAAMDHDVYLWMSVQGSRHPGASVLDSGAIVLTNDYLFHKFDGRELPHTGRLGTVVLAPQLLQILRPFIAVSDELDRQFIENLALPEFRTVQSDYIKVGKDVMSFFATYKDVPQETAISILTDEILLGRLAKIDPHGDEFREVLESAILDDNRQLIEENRRLAERLAVQRTVEQELEAERKSAIVRSQEIAELQSRVDTLTESPREVTPPKSEARIEPGPALESAPPRDLEKERLRAAVFGLAETLVILLTLVAPPIVFGSTLPGIAYAMLAIAAAVATAFLAAAIYKQHRTVAWLVGTLVAALVALSQVLVAGVGQSGAAK